MFDSPVVACDHITKIFYKSKRCFFVLSSLCLCFSHFSLNKGLVQPLSAQRLHVHKEVYNTPVNPTHTTLLTNHFYMKVSVAKLWLPSCNCSDNRDWRLPQCHSGAVSQFGLYQGRPLLGK